MGSADAHPALVVLGAGSSDSDTESRPAAGTCVLLSTECRIALCALPCLFLFGLASGPPARRRIGLPLRDPLPDPLPDPVGPCPCSARAEDPDPPRADA